MQCDSWNIQQVLFVHSEKDVIETDGAWIISKTTEPAFFHELEVKMGLGKSGSVWDFLDSVRLSLSNARERIN